MKVIRGLLRRLDVVDRTHWTLGCRNRLHCMRGQQTGLQVNDDWSKMKKNAT